MKYFIFFVILVLFLQRVYTYDLKINRIQFDIPAYLTSDVDDEYINPEHKMSYMFDGNISTTFEVNKCDSLSFVIYFDTPIRIDEIRIFNGNFESTEKFYENLRFRIIECRGFYLNEFKEELYSFYTNIEFNDKPTMVVIKNFSNSSKLFHGINFYFSSSYPEEVKNHMAYISDIQLWYKGKRYNIVNLDKLEEKLKDIYLYSMGGRIWRKNYQLETPLQYKKRPLKKWWEFWKRGKEYRIEESKVLNTMNFIWKEFKWAVGKIWVYLLLQLACFVFAIKVRKEKLPVLAKVLSVINPLLPFLLILYEKIIGGWTTYVFGMFAFLLQVLVGIILIVIVILKRKELKSILVIGYILYGILLPLSMFFIVNNIGSIM